MQKIVPHLWFEDRAEEAAKFYASIFKNSGIDSVSYYPPESRGPKGKVMMVTFHLDGQDFMALNGGPEFKFNEAISFLVNCESQAEVDDLWGKLTDGGEEGPCGWLKDRYGVSWQIIPTILGKLVSDPDAEKAGRVTQAMLQMKKIDIAALQQAYDQA